MFGRLRCREGSRFRKSLRGENQRGENQGGENQGGEREGEERELVKDEEKNEIGETKEKKK